jgi:hypothetical protein
VIGAQGAVVSAANAIASLDAHADLTTDNEVLTELLATDRAARFAELFGDRFADTSIGWKPAELAGHSLRKEIAALSPGLTNGGILIETLVRHDQFFLSVRDTFPHDSSVVTEYRFKRSDGRALPDWLIASADGQLAGHRPADINEIELTITAVLSDGPAVPTSVNVQLQTGEIREANLDASTNDDAENGNLFSNQVAKRDPSLSGLVKLEKALINR